MSASRMLVIVPAFNEEANLARTMEEIETACPQAQILIVDDGSSDATYQVAASHPGAQVVRLPFNMGIGGAVQTGFRFAAEHGFDLAVQVDADGQHIASEIGQMIRPLLSGELDVVIGSRYLGESGYRTPIARRTGMLFFRLLNSLVAGQTFTDNTSGFRAYNQKAIHFLAEHYPDDYPEVEAVVLLKRNGFRLAEVPVRMRPRRCGKSTISPARSVYYMIKVSLAVLVMAGRQPIVGKGVRN